MTETDSASNKMSFGSPANAKEGTQDVGEDQPRQMSFSDALEHLKIGRKVARIGWNGKGMYLLLAYPKYRNGCKAESVQFNRAIPGVSATMDNFIVMKTATNTLVPWLASQTDILAEDWVIERF